MPTYRLRFGNAITKAAAITATIISFTPQNEMVVMSPTTVGETVIETQEPSYGSYSVDTVNSITGHLTDADTYYDVPTDEEPEVCEPLSGVPLDLEVQEDLIRYCTEYSVPIHIALALIEHESMFQSDSVSSTNDYGLCQINRINHEWLEEKLHVSDMLNPSQNIKCGMYILGGYYKKYNDWEMALICYNSGENAANTNYFSHGRYTNGYSRSVMELSLKWKEFLEGIDNTEMPH